MTFTPHDVESALEDLEDFYGWGELDYAAPETLNVLGQDVPFKVIAFSEGGEGTWSAETYVVFTVGDQLFRKTGWYQSFDGSNWDGPLREVRAAEKLITVYEDVN